MVQRLYRPHVGACLTNSEIPPPLHARDQSQKICRQTAIRIIAEGLEFKRWGLKFWAQGLRFRIEDSDVARTSHDKGRGFLVEGVRFIEGLSGLKIRLLNLAVILNRMTRLSSL